MSREKEERDQVNIEKSSERVGARERREREEWEKSGKRAGAKRESREKRETTVREQRVERNCASLYTTEKKWSYLLIQAKSGP